MKKRRSKKKQSRLVVLSTLQGMPARALPYAEAIAELESLVRGNQFDTARHVAEQLIKALPDDVVPRLLLLENYSNSRQLAEGDTLAAEILEVFARDPLAYQECSRFYLHVGEYDKAIAALEQAISLSPNNSFCFFRLGDSHSMMGEVALATEAFTRALRIDPMNGPAHYGRARLMKERVSDKYIVQLERLIQKRQPNPNNLVSLHFAAALSYGANDPGKKFAHLHAGNTLYLQLFPWDREGTIRALTEERDFINPEQLAAVREEGVQDYQPIFIASQPRSGTTLTEQIFSAHSRTHAIGESLVFDHARRSVATQSNRYLAISSWKRGSAFAEYLPRLDKAFRRHPLVEAIPKGRRIIDKSMTNIANTGLILLTWPGARVIDLRRHPLDTTLSCYETLFAGPTGHLSSLENLALHYRLSIEQMDYWAELFPEQVLRVDYEALVANPEKVTREMLAFCELPFEPGCLEHHKNIDKSVLNASNIQVRQPLYRGSVGRWQQYADYLQPAIEILEEGAVLK